MFSTKRYDQGTGLSYYGYRFYAPVIERWLNRDPLGETGGINLYAYVQNDPVDWVDPWGLISCNDAKYNGISDCIDRYGDDLSSCHSSSCENAQEQVCELKAQLKLQTCLSQSSARCSGDLNGDGKEDKWDDIIWFMMRRLYDLRTPPGSAYPPGYGDEGPGAIDPTYIPVPPQS